MRSVASIHPDPLGELTALPQTSRVRREGREVSKGRGGGGKWEGKEGNGRTPNV